MEIRFYNTLTHSVETFAPLDPPNVTMYNCGPTVYDYAHIGNFRAFVFADVLRRFLELTGHRVHQVMNITDVGHMTDDTLADGGGQDKMQVAAERLKEAKKAGKVDSDAVANPDDPYQVARFFTDAFIDDARMLGLKIADEYCPDDPVHNHMPRATEHVGRMMTIILKLVENGHAYVAADGAVYYDVQSFSQYGQLSGNTLAQLRGGAGGRVEAAHQAVKRHPADFLLWKPDPSHIMKWESPWGVGYPGWHIECSAMAMHVLGQVSGAGHDLETIDIHTGGEDNIFPHHECEIAQSCGATGQDRFARFWMHTRFLLVDGKKMSKSKGNFHTVRDVLEGRVTGTPGSPGSPGSPVDPAVLRYELLKGHYRSNMNFTVKGLEDSASAVRKLREARGMLEKEAGGQAPAAPPAPGDHPLLARFTAALADDLNVSGALGELFGWMHGDMKADAQSLAVLRRIDSVLHVTRGPDSSGQPDEARERCAALDAARKAKDFATADHLRKELQDAGYEVMTTKDGTTARKRLA
ncbi:MAG: cysteine--tRNA ligase [Phycisphaeraceae bacterium]